MTAGYDLLYGAIPGPAAQRSTTTTRQRRQAQRLPRPPRLRGRVYSILNQRSPTLSTPKDSKLPRQLTQEQPINKRCLPRRRERAEQERVGPPLPRMDTQTLTGHGQGATSKGGKVYLNRASKEQQEDETALPRVVKVCGSDDRSSDTINYRETRTTRNGPQQRRKRGTSSNTSTGGRQGCDVPAEHGAMLHPTTFARF